MWFRPSSPRLGDTDEHQLSPALAPAAQAAERPGRRRTLRSTLDGGVHARGLGKRYGELWALRDLDLTVPAGSVLGLLGHNGAGKTTAVRLLTTLAVPTSGTASVAGFDVVAAPERVRPRIGVAGQETTLPWSDSCRCSNAAGTDP
jgi:ABC-type uncharacterized transport system ATPase subunit